MTVLCDTLSNWLAFKWEMWNNLLNHLCTFTLDTSSICGKGSHIPVLMCAVMSLLDDEGADFIKIMQINQHQEALGHKGHQEQKDLWTCLTLFEGGRGNDENQRGVQKKGNSTKFCSFVFIWTNSQFQTNALVLCLFDFTSSGDYSNIPEPLFKGSFELWLHKVVIIYLYSNSNQTEQIKLWISIQFPSGFHFLFQCLFSGF